MSSATMKKIEELGNEFLEKFKIDFESMTVEERQQLAAYISDKVPKSWSLSSNAPYYKEKYAVEIKRVLDSMLGDEKKMDRFIDPIPLKLSRRSLSQRINQGFLYLITFMDTPDKRYLLARTQIEVCLERKGVRLRWKIHPKNILDAQPIEPEYPWRDKLQDYLMNAKERERLTLKGLFMSPEQMAQARTLVEQMGEDFHIFEISPTKIDIIKFPKGL